MTKVQRGETFTLGIVSYPGVQRAAVYGLTDLLEAAAREHTRRRGPHVLAVRHWELDDRAEPAQPLAALILPPSLSEQPPAPLPAALRSWLLARYAEGTTLCSVCVGAFALADLGLLDGRPATTHWALGEALQARYPAVRVDTDKLIIDDGDVITAGGLMAWIDLGLRLVGRFLGPSTMLATARLFLVDPGGREQRFYSSFSPVLTHGDEAIVKVQRWLQSTIGQPVSVAMMAAKAGLGKRTFLRRFQRATGLKTTHYLQHLCVGKARELLELTSMSQQQIAWEVGYEDPGAFRRVFIKLMGLSPSEYRCRFSAGAAHQKAGRSGSAAPQSEQSR